MEHFIYVVDEKEMVAKRVVVELDSPVGERYRVTSPEIKEGVALIGEGMHFLDPYEREVIIKEIEH